jgi:carboxymethylenebutenolidase
VSSSTTGRVELSVADGTTMGAYVSRPRRDGKAPAIIVFQEAFGVNAHIRDVADRFASLGMLAAAPELFHRTGPGFEGDYTDFEAVRPHVVALSAGGINADIDAAYGWLESQNGVDAARICAVGFCMGGRVAYMANARTKLSAAISFYGGGIAPDLLDLAKTQSGPILMFWGGLDKHIPPEQYRSVADALSIAGAIQEQVVFGQADHGFFCDARASYSAIAARQAWALVKEFLAAYDAL